MIHDALGNTSKENPEYLQANDARVLVIGNLC